IELPKRVSPRQPKQSGVHASLFCGCVMDVFYNHVNHASIRLMVKQGHSVVIPKQTCCGALAYHAGEYDIATSLAKKNILLFGHSSSPIVVTSAGCGAMLKHYGEMLHDDRDFGGRAEAFSERVLDLSEFLSAHEFEAKAKPLEETITYHAACHLAHAQKVRKPPQELLARLDSGSEEPHVVPLVEAEHCCGSAGIYNLFNTALSLKVLSRKMDHIQSTGAKTVVTCNPGCMLQLEAGVKERNLDVQVKHLAEILDEHL
ncbi:MAG: (Fe-S)-binding protein, partial [Cyanobacteria bacterium]|nr:(Fe-S)-binding protein [Cyanobacteriota bacterium]